MPISPIEPIHHAMARMKRILFQPFDMKKWWVLGFCAWLADLGESGGRFNYSSGRGGPAGGGGNVNQSAHNAWHWIHSNLSWLIPVVIAGVLIVLAIGIVLLWIRCRGKFMFLDGIVMNRARVREPWKEWRTQGNSLFWFSFWLMWISFGAFLLIAGLGLWIALPDIRARTFGWPAGLGITIGALLLLASMFILGMTSALTNDLVTPIMYLRRVTIGPAWREFRHSIAPGNVGSIVLFYLMKIAIGFVCVILLMVGTCLTCCLAILPYIGAVIFLPISVFTRCYSLYFLQQFGAGYQIFPVESENIVAFPVIMNVPPPPPPPPMPPSTE